VQSVERNTTGRLGKQEIVALRDFDPAYVGSGQGHRFWGALLWPLFGPQLARKRL
jgi:hypothetical protein